VTSVALGVVAFRDGPALDRLLASAQGFDEVLVANVTVDPTVADVCSRHGAREVPVPGNPGFAAGVGALAARATADQLLFCNDDVELLADTAAVARRVGRPGGVVAPALVDAAGQPTPSVHALPTPGRVLLELVALPDHGPEGLGVQKWRRPTATEPVPAVTAAAVLVDRQVLLRHPLPTEYFLYWEELSWFWALRDAGVDTVLEPALRVRRDGGRSEVGADKWRLLGANLVRLGEERYGPVGRVGYGVLAVLWLGRLALTDVLRGDRARLRARRAGLAGVRSALGAPR
jgi:GT2 family glycosyltransferase